MAPVGIYSRLKAYYTGQKEPEIPPVTTTTAVALLIAYTVIYVAPFYLSSTTRPSPNLSRDAPSVIRGRIRSVTTSCIICSIFTFVLLSSVENGSPIKSIHHMGWFPIGILEALKSVGLTAVLFLGPLFEGGIAEGRWRDWIRLRGLNTAISGWIGWRNFIAGPITEEVLFRSASVPLLLLARTSNTTIIFLTPIIFGLAHIHHFYEFRITHPDTPIIDAIMRTVSQLSYTTLFGGYVTFLYMRTGSLLGVILVHAFCNWMGLPRFWGRVTAGESAVVERGLGEGKRSEDAMGRDNDGKLSVVWTIAYYILLVVGAVSWWKYLWLLTESELALTLF
ncbi:CAAX protease self-immunity-domain-containing protein [Rhexocercosporidium sp. MPI-PUGE-AT-0058]|nr:CAAX protease self-immunity-domain-containing protein [Rhexocercosporidium sp. MPI-PUGE-AT-0058]